MGEVHTGLLQNSGAVSASMALELLTAVRGVRVRHAERPIAYALSPDAATGVDCELASSTGARVRGIGTIVSRVAITGGHVAQGSAFTVVARGTAGRRLPWAHYLARPGSVETAGKFDAEQLLVGFLATDPGDGLLDLGAISARAMDVLQTSLLLDHRPALKASRTRMRWAFGAEGGAARSINLTIHRDSLRTVRVRTGSVEPATAAAFCEDLAMHDWLLTTLLAYVGRARIGTTPRSAVVRRLQPTIDYLIHLWMPTARIDATLAELWESLDRHLGLTRQWQATVERVRDQLALATVEVLHRARDD